MGATLVSCGDITCPHWGIGNSAPKHVRANEVEAERAVSAIIRKMPFLWLAVEDEPGRQSVRGVIERSSIALLSNYGKPPLDAPSANWRGLMCDRGKARVRDSGLWNQNHVDEAYDPGFLDVLEALVARMGRST